MKRKINITIENLKVIDKALAYENLLKTYEINKKITDLILRYSVIKYLPDPDNLPILMSLEHRNEGSGIRFNYVRTIQDIVVEEYHETYLDHKRTVLLLHDNDQPQEMSGFAAEAAIEKYSITSDIFVISIFDSVMHIYKRSGSSNISTKRIKMWKKLSA